MWWISIIGIALLAVVIPTVAGKGLDTSEKESRDKKGLLYGQWAVVGILLIQVLLVARDLSGRAPPPNWGASWVVANFGFAIEIGLLVGATELISRYRDAPFAPLRSVPGALYILFNGAASALAYYLLVLLGPEMKEPLRTFTAGIAAMAFFRSALFNVRLGGADVPVGPNLILLTFLKALDRTYDRERAAPRSEQVKAVVGHLSFDRTKNSLPALCTDLMQNLSQDETNELNTQLTQLTQSTSMDDRSKMLSLGLALLDLVGETTLKAAVNTLGSGANAFRPVDDDLLVSVAIPEPETVLETLPGICATLSAAAPHDASREPVVLFELSESLSPESRAVLLVYQLVGYYGDQLVRVAVNLVEGIEEASSPPESGRPPQESDPLTSPPEPEPPTSPPEPDPTASPPEPTA
jgi:hypothetical protein